MYIIEEIKKNNNFNNRFTIYEKKNILKERGEAVMKPFFVSVIK